MIDKNNVYDPIKYMQLMGSISHTYGNALAFIQKWLTDLFPENFSSSTISFLSLVI